MFKLNPDPTILREINPFKSVHELPLTEKSGIKDDGSCSMGTGIVLKRIVRKLFYHMDTLQPHELDHEFIYQSSLSYEDYLKMLKYLDGEKFTCDSLHGLDSLLSNFIANAEVRRPSQMGLGLDMLNALGELFNNVHTSSYDHPWNHLLLVLSVIFFLVIFIAWVLGKAGYSRLYSFLYGLGIVGLIQYFIQEESQSISEQKAKQYACINSGWIAKLLGKVGIDYNGCNSLNSAINGSPMTRTNVALTMTRFLSELIFDPMVAMALKIGQASQSFLGSFNGLNWLLAPFLLVMLYLICFKLVAGLITNYLVYGRSPRISQVSNKHSNGRMLGSTNSPRRSSIICKRGGFNSVKKKK